MLSALMFACADKNEFSVSGQISGASGTSVVVERSDATGRWVALDSVKTATSGKFKIDVPGAGAPEVYRLVCDGKYIYFPVDSTEDIVVMTSLKEFGSSYTLAGSRNAVDMMNFDKEVNALPSDAGDEQMAAFKRGVYSKYLQNAKGNIVSYYVLTRRIGDRPLFDPANARDAKIYAAVATAYNQYRPHDPHTAYLQEISLQGLRKANTEAGKKQVIEAPEVGSFEIELPDTKGDKRKLSDVIGKGRPVVLAFVSMTDKAAPAFNQALRQLHSRGDVEIFEVGFDADRLAWKQAAESLPWINVYDTEGGASQNIVNYNLRSLPVCYLFNAQGDLVKRAANPSELL